MTAPVMNVDSLLNKKAIRLATSEGLPTLFKADSELSRRMTRFPVPATDLAWVTIGVSIVPLRERFVSVLPEAYFASIRTVRWH